MKKVTGATGTLLALATLFASPILAAVEPRNARDVEYVIVDTRDLPSVRSKAVSPAQDVEGIAIVQISGNYDRGNSQARIDVANRYFERYEDQIDLLLVFSAFEFETGEATAFANIIKNDVDGIGLERFDSSAAFGSGGRLHNYVDMAAISRHELNPSSARFGVTLDIAVHEIMHRWLVHPRFLRDGQVSEDLLGRDRAHWSFFLDSDASVMYGADWRPLANGQYESFDVRHRLSALDLYLAGLFSAAEVPDLALIRNGSGANAQDLPQQGFLTSGDLESISVAQLIAANGTRLPDVADARKRFSAGIVFLLRPGQPLSERALFDLQRFSIELETRFASMTRGRGTLSVQNKPRTVVSNGSPRVVAGGLPCGNCTLDIGLAKSWLLSQQEPASGAFEDKPGNRFVATAAALRAMRSSSFGMSGPSDQALGQIEQWPGRQFDDLAWKERLDIELTSSADQTLRDVRNTQAADRSPGIGPDWSASPWDSASLTALASFTEELTPAQRTAHLIRLRAMQNTDGGFGVSPGGVSHVGLTAWVLNELSGAPQTDAAAIRAQAADWLLLQRQPNGAFGAGNDAVLPTVWAVSGLVGNGTGVVVASSIEYLRARQSAAGDWNGSVFTTAEVIRVLGEITKPNLTFDGSILAEPSLLIAGDRAHLRGRIRNDGVLANDVSIQWFVGNPDSGGTPLTVNQQIGTLASGQSQEVTAHYDTAAAGTTEIWAVLDFDNVLDELNEDDNRQSVSLLVQPVPDVPDLVLRREDFSTSPQMVSVFPTQISISGQVRNLGGAPAAGVAVVVYAIQGSTRIERARAVVDISALGATPVELGYALQRGEGSNLIVIVDPDNSIAEIRESNNELRIDLPSAMGIDLAIDAGDLVQLTQPAVSGQPVRFRATAHNFGATASLNFAMKLDIETAQGVVSLGNVVLHLDAGAIAEREVVWTSSGIGPATLKVALDPSQQSGDVNRDNNAASLAFEVIDATQPNLLVDTGSLQLTPLTLDQSAPASMRARIRNAGATFSSDVVVAVSSGAENGPRNELSRVVHAGGIQSGADVLLDMGLPPLPDSGERYFFVTVDPDQLIAELNDDDNTAFLRATVRSIPDASISIASISLTPSVPVPGESVTAVVQVRNLGQQPLVNLGVRLLDGFAGSGSPVGEDRVVSMIAGVAIGEASWTWTFASVPGPRALTAIVDAESRIAEIREDNNLAVLPLQELAEHFATEPYISPNDDGIKESTQIVFRNLSESPAVIDIRDIGETIVRTYPPEQFVGGNGIAVLWDGRDNGNRLVPDARYRVEAVGQSGTLLASVPVVVDTNRSSILEALGTPLEHLARLELGPNGREVIHPPESYDNQDAVLIIDPLNSGTPDPIDRLRGIYRYDLVLKTLDPIVDGAWLAARGGDAQVGSVHWAASGEHVIFILRVGSVYSVWKAKSDGRNQASQMSAANISNSSAATMVSRGLSEVLLWAYSEGRLYNLDTGAETILRTDGGIGELLRVLPDGFLVGYSSTRLAFIWFDPARPAQTVMDSQGPGQVTHVGGQGAIVHRIEAGREILEWRDLRSAQRRTLTEYAVTPDLLARRRCRIKTETTSWFGGDVLINDYAKRNIALINVDTGIARELSLPTLSRRGEYIQLHDLHFEEYTPSVRFLFSEENTDCGGRVLANGAIASADASAKIEVTDAKSFQGSNGRYDAEPLTAFVVDGESVHVRDETPNASYEFELNGASAAYLLDRRSGALTVIGRFSAWPLTDPVDQANFPFPYEDVPFSALRGLEERYRQLSAVRSPLLQLADGSGLSYDAGDGQASNYSVFLPGGYFNGAVFPYQFSSNYTLVKPAVNDAQTRLYGTDPGVLNPHWFYGSFANQATKLRVRGSANGFDLLGVADDQNFQKFELEWANAATPSLWNAVAPAVLESVNNGEFMSWAPPAPGQYVMRLSSEDKAGNVTRTTSTGVSVIGADISNPRMNTRYISPNGDSVQDELVVSMDVVRPTNLEFLVRAGDGSIVHRQVLQVSNAGPLSFVWDGKLQSGVTSAEGAYRASVNNWFAASFVLDVTPPVVQIRRLRQFPAHPEWMFHVRESVVDSAIYWISADANPDTSTLQKYSSDGSTEWTDAGNAIAGSGSRRLPSSDLDLYRIFARDRAGNTSTSAATETITPELRWVGRRVVNSGDDPVDWGCDSHVPQQCAYRSIAFDPSPMAVAERELFELSYFLAPNTPSSGLQLRYRVNTFGTTPGNSAWQSMVIEHSQLQGTELSLRVIMPTLPPGSSISVQAWTTLTNGSIIGSEVSSFNYFGISIPKFYSISERCTPVGSEVGLPEPISPAGWVCVEEGLQEQVSTATLTSFDDSDEFLALQSATTIVDGVILFELRDPRCKYVVARVTGANGRVYSSRSDCPPEIQTVVHDSTRVYPLAQFSCEAESGHLMGYSAALFPRPPVTISRLQIDFELSDGSRRIVSDRTDVVPVDQQCWNDEACLEASGYAGTFDASDLPDGRYELRFRATLSTGDVVTAQRSFHVDRTPLLIDLQQPREGRRECVTHLKGEFNWVTKIPSNIIATDPSGLSAMVELAPIPPQVNPVNWSPPALSSWKPLSGLRREFRPATAFTYSRTAPLPFPPGGEQQVGPIIGSVQLRVAAMNWGGAPQCRTVHFFADGVAEGSLAAAPETIHQLFPPRRAVINPAGAPSVKRLSMVFDAQEPLLASLELWRGATSDSAVRIDELIPARHYAQGQHHIQWDGRLSNGSSAGDDTYWMSMSIEDDCGHVSALRLPVMVDTSPPVASFDSPIAGQNIDGLLVEINGLVEDATGGSYVLMAQTAESTILAAETLQPKTGEVQRFSATWNRGVTSGPAIIRLTGVDLVGNEAVYEVPINLLPRPVAFFDDARALPPLISPNADAQFDVTEVRYALAVNADVSVRILRLNGEEVTTLRNSEPAIQGNHAISWRGEGLSGPGIDGVYQLLLRAVSPTNPALSEELRLPIVVDVRPPELQVTRPETQYSKGLELLSISVSEPHFGSGHWQFAGRQGDLSAAGPSYLLELAEVDEGTHTLTIAAADTVANRANLETTITVDRTPPLTAFSAPEEAAVLGGAVTSSPIIGSAADTHLERHTLLLESEPAGPPELLVESTQSIESGTLHALSLARPDGAYRLRLIADDKAGHRSEATRLIQIDHTPPVAVLTAPVNQSFVSRSFQVMGTASDLNLSEYRLRIATPEQANLGHWSDLVFEYASVTDGVLGTVDLAFPDGDYLLQLFVRDRVQQTAEAQIRIRLDATPPVAPIELVANRAGSEDVLLAWNDMPAADFAGYQVYRDGAKLNAQLIPGRSFRDAQVPEGLLRYEVTANDTAGNESARSNQAIIAIDRTPPEVALFAPADQSLIHGEVEVIGTAVSADDFDRYRLSLLDGNQVPVSVLVESSVGVRAGRLTTWDTSALPEGSQYQLLLEAWDQSGNRAEARAQVTVDNLPPAAPTGLTAVDISGDGHVQWNANSEADLLGYVLLRNGNPVNGGTSFPNDLRVLAIPEINYLDAALVDGRHQWVVFAIDQAGNLSPPSLPAELTISRRPPDIRIAEPTQNTRFDSSIPVRAVSDDEDIAQVWFEVQAAGGTGWSAIGSPLTTAPYVIAWTPENLPYGFYDIRVQARDQGGLEDATPGMVRVEYADLQAPPKVIELATRVNGGAVRSTWKPVDVPDLDHYVVSRSDYSSGGFVAIAEVAAGTSEYLDVDRPDGNGYYQVQAVDASANVGAASDVVAARVFSLQVDAPFSPIRELATALTGQSPLPGLLQVSRDDAGGAVVLHAGAIEQRFDLADLPVLVGENRLLITVTDADLNVSRSAEAWVTSGPNPSAPTGLSVVVDQNEVATQWQPNPESNILGYRLFLNDAPDLIDEPSTAFTPSSATPEDNFVASMDGDANTAWLDGSWFYDNELDDVWLELNAAEPVLVRSLQFTWRAGRAPLAFDIDGHSGHTWVRLARIDEVNEVQTIALAEPYRTARLRIVPRFARYGQSLALAEVAVIERPVLTQTTQINTLIDGRYEYTVSAVNELGFEGARSAPVTAEVGDAQPPDSVVLSGTVAGRDAQLSWTPATAPDLARYQLRRDGQHLSYVDAATTSYVDAGLANGNYVYTVFALDAFDNTSPPSNAVTLTISQQGPGLPERLTVTALPHGGALDVRWQPGVGAPSVRFLLRRSLAQVGPYTAVLDANLLMLQDQPLVNDTRYWYTVEAFDASGNASGQTLPVSGVPRDQLGPLPPTMTYPVAEGASVDFFSTQTRVSGASEAATRVKIRRAGVVMTEVTASTSDLLRRLDGGYADGLLRASPSGDWFFGSDSQQIYEINTGNESSRSGFGSVIDWTRDDRVVHGDAQNGWQHSALAGDDNQNLPLPATEIEQVRFSSDLRYVLFVGQATVNATLERALWLFDRESDHLRRVLTVNPDEVAFFSIVFSEESGFAAWRSSNADLWVLRLSTAQARVLANDVADRPLALAATNGETLLVREIDGIETVMRVSVDGDQRSVSAGRGAAWSPLADEYVLMVPDDRLAVYDATTDLPTRVLAPDVGELQSVVWTSSGRLIVHGANDLASVDPAGYFRSEPLTLQPGDNALTLFAEDQNGYGQDSLGSGTVRVLGTITLRPDLSVQPQDIRFVPAVGVLGDVIVSQFTVRNLGNGNSAVTPLRISLIAPNGSQSEIVHSLEVPNLAPGASRSFGLSLGAMPLSGTWWLSVELRVAGDDSNNSNHLARQRFDIAVGPDPVLEVRTDASSFAPGVDATGFVSVRNLGTSWRGLVQMSILTMDGAEVAVLPDVAIPPLAFGAESIQSWRWPTAGVFAGTYQIRARLLDQDNRLLQTQTAAFDLQIIRDLRLDVAAGQSTYAQGASVALNATLDYRSGNVVIRNGAVRIHVLDAGNQQVFTFTRPLATLLPGYRVQIPAVWSNGSSVGVHSVRAELVESAVVTRVAENSFVVQAAGNPTLVSGLITPTPVPIIAGRSGQVGFALRNAGVAPVGIDNLRLRLLRAETLQQVAMHSVSGTALAGDELASQLLIAPDAIPLGAYLAVLDWQKLGSAAYETLASRSVSVVDGVAPDVAVRAPDAGGWTRADATISAAVTDAHSGVDRVEIAVDGSVWRVAALQPLGTYGITTLALADGPHAFLVRARDRAGNETLSAVHNFRVDATAPLVSISGVAEGAVVSMPVVPLIDIVEVNLERSVIALNGAPFVSGTTVSADGSYLLSAIAYDLAGNSGVATRRFVIDTRAPIISFVTPQDGVQTTLASIEARLQTEPSIAVQLTAGAWSGSVVADSAGIATFASVPLMSGANDLLAIATDGAGLSSTPAMVRVLRRDESGASLIGSLAPSAPEFVSGAAVTLNWQVVNSSATLAQAQTLRIVVEHVASSQVLGDASFTVDVPGGGEVSGVRSFDAIGAALGRYAATLSVQSGPDLVQLATAEFDIVDREPPDLQVLQPSEGALLNTLVRIQALARDALGQVSEVRYQIDGQPSIAMSVVPGMPDNYASTDLELADASYVLAMQATDNFGNTANASARLFTVDRTPPQINISGVADQGRYATAVTPVISISDLHPGTLSILLDGQSFVSGSAVDTEGTHILEIQAEDQAGNVSQRALRFDIDRTAPVIAFSYPEADAVLTNALVDVGGLTESAVRVEFRLGITASTVFADGLGGFVVPGVTLGLGANILEARALDDLGNASEWVQRTVFHQPNVGAELTAELMLSTIDLPLGDDLIANYRLDNIGTGAVVNMAGRLRWLRLADQQVLDEQGFTFSLPGSGTHSGSVTFASAATMPGAHVVVLEAFMTNAVGVQSWQGLATAQAIVRDVAPPMVELLSPDADQFVDTGFILRVRASDVHSALQRVEGLVASAPILLSATAVPDEYTGIVKIGIEGHLTLSAHATDTAGNAAQSAARQVIVDLLPPQISITGIDEGQLVNTPVTLGVSMLDVSPLQSTITLNGSSYVPQTPISIEGPQLLRVTAVDALGRRSEAVRSFTIDLTPPAVIFVVPKDGAIIFGDSTRVVGNTEPFAAVRLSVGAFSANLVADDAGVFSRDNVPLVPGLNTLTAHAVDRAGNVGAPSMISVERRAQPVVALQGSLQISASEWANGTLLEASFNLHNIGTAELLALPVRLRAKRADTQQVLQSADFTFDLQPDAQRNQTFSWPTQDWGLGRVDVELLADLPARRAPVVLDTHALQLIDREAPNINFVEPVAQARVAPNAEVRVHADDRLSQIQIVWLRIDDGDWFALALEDEVAGTWRGALPDVALGPHTLTSRTRDDAGNEASTGILPIAVAAVLPLQVIEPIDGSSNEALVTRVAGNTIMNAMVRLRRGSEQWQVFADASGQFRFEAVPLAPGLNTFIAQSEDSFGNQSAEVTVRVTANGVAMPIPLFDRVGVLLLLLGFIWVSGIRTRNQELL